jgi:PAS domain S-box-containing protein
MPDLRARLAQVYPQITLIRALVALGVVLIAINIGSAIFDVRNARARTEDDALRDYVNLTRLLSEQTAASLEAADLVLRDAMRGGNAREAAAMTPRLREELGHFPQIAGFVVIDERGKVIARTNELPAIDPDFGTQPFFAAHRDGRDGGGVMMSDPFLGGPVGTSWRFVLSRRLSGPGGTFGGVLAAVLEIESFDRLYRTIDVGDGGFITLLSEEGVLMTRVPDPLNNARGRKYPDNTVAKGIQRDGRYEGWVQSPIMNARVLLAASAVRGFPLMVVSGSGEEAVLAPWKSQTRMLALRTLLTSAAMMALIGLAAWGLARRERSLQRRDKLFRAMIEHSSDAVLLSRPGSGGIFYASPSVERITGHDPRTILGHEPFEWLHPDHLQAALRQREELLRSPGKSATSEIMVRRRDSEWLWFESTVTNLLEEPGVHAVVINLRDISERKQADAERARLEQRLRQAEKMEAVGRLAGGIAHDFNNILGGILGYAEMLVEGTEKGSRQRRYAENVLAAAARASDLVEQILNYSRAQRGKRIPVELDRVVAETLELVRGSLPSGIRLAANLSDSRLFVVGDPTQLHQIVMNLCTNAIHAMGESGTLSVSVAPAQVAGELVFAHSTLLPGAYVRITVEDTGSGMDAATLARVFEPFFTTKEVGKGTGLGLSIVYGIVTEALGALDVSSVPGKGSRFTIYLPRVDSPVIPEEVGAAPVARGNGERILVVDDEEALVALASEVLKRLGYEPAGFTSAPEALAAFEAAPERFDAAIADEVMPELTGTELAAAMRRRRPSLPVVLMSGYIGPMMTERALAAGVREILRKPVQSRELAGSLARALSGAEAPLTL